MTTNYTKDYLDIFTNSTTSEAIYNSKIHKVQLKYAFTNITTTSGSGTTKLSASEIELQNTIIRAGFIPSKRDSKYNHLSTIINDSADKEYPSPIPSQVS